MEVQRVNVDFPKHFLLKLDREAELRGVSRQALIKTWLYERLQFGVNPKGSVKNGAKLRVAWDVFGEDVF